MTGNHLYAGTDANITVYVKGTDGGASTELDDTDPTAFEPGK